MPNPVVVLSSSGPTTTVETAEPREGALLAAKLLSGVVLQQNQPPAAPTDFAPLRDSWVYQDFLLPANFQRGADAQELRKPSLTGFQFLANVVPDYADTATFDWKIERYVIGSGWTTLDWGTEIGVQADGDEVWLDAYFTRHVDIPAGAEGSTYRIGVRGRAIVSGRTKNRIVPYDDKKHVTLIDQFEVRAKLTPNVPYPFDLDGVPSFLLLNSSDGQVYYSVQQGIQGVWFSLPNPMRPTTLRAYDETDTPIRRPGGTDDTALPFRVLAAVADEGTDYLGNTYRNVVVTHKTENVINNQGAFKDQFWLSKPNPSRFAVESLYFDVRSPTGEAQVIDRVLADPLTPGVYFNVYYSNDGDPALSEASWDDKLWKRVPQTFRLTRRESLALPEPITAKYIKVEFTHLQARFYSPGDFERPIRYKKHPKWVLDYFLLRVETDRLAEQQSPAGRVAIRYDALDLAYNYYLDDLVQEPEQPIRVDPTQRNRVIQEVGETLRRGNEADSEVLAKIDTAFRPYQRHPALWAKLDYLLSEAINLLESDNYSSEVAGITTAVPIDTSALRGLQRDRIIYEADMPVMYYFVECRHRYKHVQATFSHNRAYFVGLKEIGFSREQYTKAHDTDLYIEPLGDNVNIERNDFTLVDSVWKVHG